MGAAPVTSDATPPAQHPVGGELRTRFPDVELREQTTADAIPTFWLPAESLPAALRYLKNEAARPYKMLYDLTMIDERLNQRRGDQPASDFTAVYHLLSPERNSDVRLKVALAGEAPSMASVTGVWPAADWYEREAWDMFGVTFTGHPNLRRILNPPWWEGHPLRKEHPARATEMGPLHMPPETAAHWQDMLTFRPQEWGLPEPADGSELMFLNVGPQHGGTHGVVHIVVGLRDEEIVECIVDIGYHHRGAEKMGERQSWHTFIPYTDRVEYLGGVMNNLAYLLSVEAIAGISVPPRAQVIRVMMAELYRIASHLVLYGTFAQDVGALSPVFYMFSDRERLFDIAEAITGGRMHPNWFRIGGVAEDLPQGWDKLIREYIPYLEKRLREYDHLVMESRIVKARGKGVGTISEADAYAWGVTGPNLRSCGPPFDLRKLRPYSSYDQFEFEVPTATGGDVYDRIAVRVEEIRQSLRIVRQCLEHMPSGPYKSDHPLTTPPLKEPGTMHHIETLIHHFLSTTWGLVLPPGEACVSIEATKGINGYYLVSDGGVHSYRTRIRTPSFPHLQVLPLLCRGLEVADLIAILGSIDFVMSDVDR
jgi:NADH-quinone oxidoreductase subunit C/D